TRGFIELYPVPGLFREQHEHAGYPLPDLPYVVVLALEQFPAPALMLVPVRIFAERAAVTLMVRRQSVSHASYQGVIAVLSDNVGNLLAPLAFGGREAGIAIPDAYPVVFRD